MGEEWLTLREVAALLGVHPSTVRLWSNRGLLPVHRTPGGHRRYKRSEVSLWMEGLAAQRKDFGEPGRAAEPENVMQQALKNVRLHIAEAHLEAEGWYQKLDEEARQQYRNSARSLLQGLMTFMASQGGEGTSEAYAIGYEYASRARRYGLSYVDAARAFLFFRNALIESLIEVYRQANVLSGQVWQGMLRQIHAFTDQILLTLLETYQKLEGGGQ